MRKCKKSCYRMYSDAQVYKICAFVEAGWTYEEICKKLSLNPENHKKNISGIIRGRIYQDISSQFELPTRFNARFSKEEVEGICKCLSEEYSVLDICHYIGYKKHSYASIRQTTIKIYNREWYKNISKKYDFPPTLITKGFNKL